MPPTVAQNCLRVEEAREALMCVHLSLSALDYQCDVTSCFEFLPWPLLGDGLKLEMTNRRNPLSLTLISVRVFYHGDRNATGTESKKSLQWQGTEVRTPDSPIPHWLSTFPVKLQLYANAYRSGSLQKHVLVSLASSNAECQIKNANIRARKAGVDSCSCPSLGLKASFASCQSKLPHL